MCWYVLLAQKRNEKFSFPSITEWKNLTYSHNSALELQHIIQKKVKYFPYLHERIFQSIFCFTLCVMYYLYNVLTQKLQISRDYDNENIAFYFAIL